MKSAICTLFEKSYHYGVAALTNSFYRNGFRGTVFAGYKGDLPKWAESAEKEKDSAWPGASRLAIKDGLNMLFLPVEGNFHMTNYKPEFMLRLWDGVAKDAEQIAYFDPDIVIDCPWDFFERWMDYGVALVHEIIHNDMPPTHPIRKEWELAIQKCNKKVVRQLYSYINGGFCGVNKLNIEFLRVWAEIIELGITHYKADATKFLSFNRTHPFWSIDQDAINATAMCCESSISEIGPDGMNFIYGGWTMSHATGHPKPWAKNFFRSALDGQAPSKADRAYWFNLTEPIKNYSHFHIQRKHLAIKIAALFGRFYQRN
jgi:hypothetical protein